MAGFPRRRSFRRQSTRYQTFPATQNIAPGIANSRKNYVSEQSGTYRHELIFNSGLDGIGLGEYATVNLCRFRRSFGAGEDDPPTATVSNNYPNSSAFNGSRISGFSATLKFQNHGDTRGQYIDVYQISTSFADTVYMDAVYSTFCPIEFQGSTPVGSAGEVTFKDPIITWTENNYKNYKGIQKHIKFLGTVFVSSEDGGAPAAQFKISGIPGKNRRSQTGMFYGLMLHYSTDKNDSTGQAACTVDCTVDLKFHETPSENRLPFVW